MIEAVLLLENAAIYCRDASIVAEAKNDLATAEAYLDAGLLLMQRQTEILEGM